MEEILSALIAIWGFGGAISLATATGYSNQIFRPFFQSFYWYYKYQKGLIPSSETLNGNKFKMPRGGKSDKKTTNCQNRR